MSRLAAALNLKGPGKTFAVMKHFEFQEKPLYEPIQHAHEYIISGVFSVSIRSTDEELRSGRHADKVVKAKLLLLDEVFGEFIPDLREAEHLAMNYQGEEAAEIIRTVINSFKDPGEWK